MECVCVCLLMVGVGSCDVCLARQKKRRINIKPGYLLSPGTLSSNAALLVPRSDQRVKTSHEGA